MTQNTQASGQNSDVGNLTTTRNEHSNFNY
jgi:hypothetical protein